jgi:putative acetyltransferase
MHIRPYNSQDAGALAIVFHEAVHQIGSIDYTKEQVDAWSAQPVSSDQFDKRVSDGRQVFVAVDSHDSHIGFIELETNGHIDCFYCSPAHAGTGVGAALYAALEKTAIEQGINELFVEASEAARKFFSKVGFDIQDRRDFQHKGVWIHNYKMTKRLA